MRRRLYWVIVHAVLVLAFSRYLLAPLTNRAELAATDFTVFYTGWSLVLNDPAHTYDVDAQRRAQAVIMHDLHFEGGVMTFYYPPHAAVALAPFAALSFENAFRLWMLLQVLCLGVLVRWLWELAETRDPLDRAVVATAVAAFLPVLYALQIGQLSIAMTLALVGFWRAFGRGSDAGVGLWLFVLTMKPQLLPVPLLLLLASRRFRPFAWACVFGVPFAVVATLRLGPRVWIDYPHQARQLENFVAGGSHDHMLNLRGLLTRLAGLDHEHAIFVVSAAVVAAASVGIYRLFRRFAGRGAIPAVAFGAGLAVALPVNLHLHLQDAVVWTIPLAIFAAYLRREGPARRFEIFALSWPLVFVLTYAAETATGHLLPVPPPLVLAVVLAIWMLRALDAPLAGLARSDAAAP